MARSPGGGSVTKDGAGGPLRPYPWIPTSCPGVPTRPLAVHLRVRGLRQRAVVLAGMVDERTRELARAKEDTEAALVTVEAQATQLRSLDEAKSRSVPP